MKNEENLSTPNQKPWGHVFSRPVEEIRDESLKKTCQNDENFSRIVIEGNDSVITRRVIYEKYIRAYSITALIPLTYVITVLHNTHNHHCATKSAKSVDNIYNIRVMKHLAHAFCQVRKTTQRHARRSWHRFRKNTDGAKPL